MEKSAEELGQEMDAFIALARQSDCVLHIQHYQETYLPDELEAARRKGRALWGMAAWTLIPRADHIAKAKAKRQEAWDKATKRIEAFEAGGREQ